jgi:acetylornithine deacetylase/succinyl-diaminopimelate desuccinylase-like protein
VPELTAPPNTYDLLNKRWCSPSLSIVDIRTTTSNSSSSSTAGPTGSSSSSKPGGGLREYAHSAAVTQRSSVAGGGSFTVVQQHAGRLGGCPHGSHSGVECGNLWPSVVVTHTEKHGAAEAGAGGADDRSCYRFGPTRFSVIPKVAVGKISLRFVPEQDHRTLIECLQQHIEKRFKLLWSANKVELQVG